MAKKSTATQPVTTADETASKTASETTGKTASKTAPKTTGKTADESARDAKAAKNLARKFSEERLRNQQPPSGATRAELWAFIQHQKAELSQQDQPVELVNFSARVPKATAQAIKTQAAIQGRKVQDVVTQALTEWLETHTED